jgi:glutaredoxin 3
MSVTIHTKSGCVYCDKAKDFFKDNNIPYEEVYYDANADTYEQMKNELVNKTHHRTFPQIFIGSKFIGGYSEMVNMYSTLEFHKICKEELDIDIEYDF